MLDSPPRIAKIEVLINLYLIQLVISIAELIKSVTQEYAFPRPTLAAVGTVVRPTKDLYILMNSSSFRHMAESQQPSPHNGGSLSPTPYSASFPYQPMTATPLSAALGHAAQATMPQGYPGYGPMGMGSANGFGSRSATLLSQSHPTMTSAVGEMGMQFGNGIMPAGLMSPGAVRDMKSQHSLK